jgi:hypothetical protein
LSETREQRSALIVHAVRDYLVSVENKADVTTDDLFECTRRFGFTWEETVAAQKYCALMEAETCGSA